MSKLYSTRRNTVILTAILVSMVVCGVVSANGLQTQSQSSGSTGNASSPSVGRGSMAALVSPEEDYRIGPNDVLEIKVENMPELSRSFRVTAAGTFLMPFLGRVTAAKKTTEELAQMIADGLRGDYLKDPRVSVAVKEFNSRSFFIQGSVRNPGVFQIEGRPSMLELITLAGGLSEKHGANAYIIRKLKIQKDSDSVAAKTQGNSASPETESASEDKPRYELKSANINGLLKGRFTEDVLLEPGDIINVPPTDVFFVAGEVNAPGSFALAEGTTLRQAISLAQGTNYKAALNRGVIYRENVSGKREELHVDVGAVMNGKKDDVQIMANDIIMVPNSRGKTLGGALLKAFGISTVTRVPIP